jgi:Ran GTPase-activating protein (RanGAP) involved in mRNA processing and transport
VPQLEELFVYQNTLKEKGLTVLFQQLREHCKTLVSLDLCDNFVRGVATKELVLLLQQGSTLRGINLSDCLKES